MIVEIDEIVNEIIRFLKRLWLMAVDTLRFENGEEVFRHSVVIAISTP